MRTRFGPATTIGGGRRSRGGDGGWRSHTFSDGVCSITLTTELDRETAARLSRRLGELSKRGGQRLIVDVSAAMEPDRQAPALLAAVFQEPLPGCEVVVVMPRGSVLDGLLPGRIPVAWSLSDARRLLISDPGRYAASDGAGPGSAISASDRHALAVRQALRWALQTAGGGDYESALRGLSTIERVEGALPAGWQERRQAWILASRAQTQAPRRRRGAPRLGRLR